MPTVAKLMKQDTVKKYLRISPYWTMWRIYCWQAAFLTFLRQSKRILLFSGSICSHESHLFHWYVEKTSHNVNAIHIATMNPCPKIFCPRRWNQLWCVPDGLGQDVYTKYTFCYSACMICYSHGYSVWTFSVFFHVVWITCLMILEYLWWPFSCIESERHVRYLFWFDCRLSAVLASSRLYKHSLLWGQNCEGSHHLASCAHSYFTLTSNVPVSLCNAGW